MGDIEGSARASYLSAAATVAAVVGRIGGASWSRPGLGDWDLRALVGHTSRSLVTVLTYLDQPADTVEVHSAQEYYRLIGALSPADAGGVTARGVAAGEALGPEPAAAFAALVDDVTATLAAVGDDLVIPTFAGAMRLRDYLPTRTFELVVHGLDIARATGLECAFPAAVLSDAGALAGRIAAETGHAATVLETLTGRRPLPPGFSLV